MWSVPGGFLKQKNESIPDYEKIITMLEQEVEKMAAMEQKMRVKPIERHGQKVPGYHFMNHFVHTS